LKPLTSVSHRIEIWFVSVERASERPFLGWGLDAARKVPPSETVIGTRVTGNIGLHSHNAPINLLLELGVFGLALGAATTFAIGRKLSMASGEPAVVAALTAIFVAAFLIANVSFGVFQSWWIGSLFLTAAIARVAASQTSAR
ncbi:MAG: O-antigen ligase family protein, partial [Pseudomonadota bacterium]